MFFMLTDFFQTIEHCLRETGNTLKQMDYLHTLLVAGVVVLFILLVFRSFRELSERRAELLWSTVSAFFVCLLLFCCIIANQAGILVFEPSAKPEDTVSHFFDSFIAGDTKAAVRDLGESQQLVYIPSNTDSTGMMYYDALKDSYSYQLLGPAEIDKGHATQKVRFSYLKLSELPAPIYLYVMDDLADYVKTHKKHEIYDSDENYLPEALDEVYRNGVEHILQDPSPYLGTIETELSLDYSGKRWYLHVNDDLIRAFCGGVSPGANFANNAKSEVLQDLTFIPKEYKIAEGALVGPEPNRDKFGCTHDPAEIRALVESYPRLTGGSETFWNEDIDIKSDGISYYADDTILVIGWKQLIYNRFCTFAEVYIADPSQIRRKLSEDTFGSPIHKTATNMAAECNAVVAINGDFYKYRTVGFTTYQRQIYRFNPGALEFCHVDGNGDLLFTYAGELPTKAAAEKYIADNDILFTIAFGPVLVENYEIHYSSPNYALGEVTQNYARSSIGQTGRGHYLLMNMNFGFGTPNGTIADSCRIMQAMGCERAYALDGGQTAEIVLNNKMFNKVDYGGERYVSDIIVFDTAMPRNEND